MVRVIDLRTRDKCRQQGGRWWNLKYRDPDSDTGFSMHESCLPRPMSNTDFLVDEMPTMEGEDELVRARKRMYGQQGVKYLGSLGPDDPEVVGYPVPSDASLDDIEVFEMNSGARFRIINTY